MLLGRAASKPPPGTWILAGCEAAGKSIRVPAKNLVKTKMKTDVGYWITFAGPFRYIDLMGIPAYKTVMGRMLPELDCSKKVPDLMKKTVESGASGVSNCRGSYHYTPRQARRWQELFLKSNHEIRRRQ
jgi:3-hydroxybutyryl-CoA dehydrogenase